MDRWNGLPADGSELAGEFFMVWTNLGKLAYCVRGDRLLACAVQRRGPSRDCQEAENEILCR